MRRSDLEHLIRAASAITEDYDIVVIGSQAILGAVPFPPNSLMESIEADMYPLSDPSLSDLIDGAIGESSPFHERFGYYAQGVGPETAILPEGWKNRLVKIQNQNTDLRIGFCLEPHDLAASKLAAGREKDWAFVNEMIRHEIIDGDILKERIETLPIPDARRTFLKSWVSARVDELSSESRPRP